MILQCGCDEVGRGSGIAEIYACACVLDINNRIIGLKDSKKMTFSNRERMANIIKNFAICWCITKASLEEVENLNVHYATLLAMKRAVNGLRFKPDKVFVDGSYLPDIDIPGEAVIKGDSKILAISAASILAKVARDEKMLEYHKLYPEYGFNRNKGYFTKEHINAIKKYGPCLVHRKTFLPIRAYFKK